MNNWYRYFWKVPVMVFLVAAGIIPSGAAAFDDLFIGDKPLYIMPKKVETRWASPENWKGEKGKAGVMNAGRKGSPYFPLKAGQSKTLAEVSGTSGTVYRIWMTFENRSPEVLRGMRLDFWWDGAKKPAVSVPVGDFFGIGLGRMAAFESVFFSSPGGTSFNCIIPMPFRKGMKIVLTNESGVDLRQIYYTIEYTIGDNHGKDVLYFHACYRRENPTTLKKDYEILPHISGKGRFLGVNIGVIPNNKEYLNHWWGEGEAKIYLDGDEIYPTLAGTGTEDYVGSGWGFGTQCHLNQGCTINDSAEGQYCFYRYHVDCPIYFTRDIKVTIQQIGCWGPGSREQFLKADRTIYAAGPEMNPVDFRAPVKENLTDPFERNEYGLFERSDDWSSCAYFYLDKPENDLPPLDKVEKRIDGLAKKGK
ncbi:MAG: glycoside hydrolase family 172 protein [Candidatus Latescibacterota bacterium]